MTDDIANCFKWYNWPSRRSPPPQHLLLEAEQDRPEVPAKARTTRAFRTRTSRRNEMNSELEKEIAVHLAHTVGGWDNPFAKTEDDEQRWEAFKWTAREAIAAIEGAGYRIVPPTAVTKDMSLRMRQRLDSRIHSQRVRIARLEKDFASFAEQRHKIVRGYFPKWLNYTIKLSAKNKLLKSKIDWLYGELNWAVDSKKLTAFLGRD